ncbi:MAG TPA: HD domain-containing phosphohydrolase [Vicinamibacterales bacterium]|nr:HD domain-containing phosphohydrolase [Vicinamibacterales bacterium]
MKSLPVGARLFVGAVIAAGAVLCAAVLPLSTDRPFLFAVMAALSAMTSVLKVTLPLPRSASTMSVSYAVDFAALLMLGTEQTVIIAAISALCQCNFRIREPNPPHRTLFSMATLVITVFAAGSVYRMTGGVPGRLDLWLGLSSIGAAAATYFIVNTFLVATAIALSTQASVVKVWNQDFLWGAPGYFVGAAVSASFVLLQQFSSHALMPFALVPLYLTYRSYKIYLGRIEEEQLQVKRVADLNFATIEALALAIDAKDQTSQSHIRRVQLYATALARELEMSEHDIQGVKTAALLHDIGKLAVPEHILSKPGPLTTEEFQKIRAHPKIGADIISAVPFPYPVAPLILSHHERWDGKGYPSGLKREEIPLGARILTAVDYFDAVMAERPYHKALPFDAALALLQQESGKALDPQIVETFVRLLPKLQQEAARLEPMLPRLELVPLPRSPVSEKKNVFDDIALAHREIYALYEIAQAMGTSLGLPHTMELITSKLANLVPFSCSALFLLDDETDSLRCHLATGEDADLIQQVVVRSGDGLTGWVARNHRAVVNARPSADFEAAGMHEVTSTLQSALVCPLLANDKFIGTLALYHTEPAFYREDHRRLVERVTEQGATVIKNALEFERTRQDSLTDPLTGLPNTRNLFIHLSRELARAERLSTEVSLMVMDLDRFKEINDTHGHHMGDRALREVARVLLTAIRPYDMCVRYAGDEFIVVLSGCGAGEAEHKRQELQAAVENVVFESRPGRRVPLAISVGAAVFPQDGMSYESLLAAADSRMYQDKAARKRRSRQPVLPQQPALFPPAELTEKDLRRSSTGIL